MGNCGSGQHHADEPAERGFLTEQEGAREQCISQHRPGFQDDRSDEPPDVELAEEGEVLARSYELGDHEVLDDEQGDEHDAAVAQPLGDDPSPGLRLVARLHPLMLSGGALQPSSATAQRYEPLLRLKTPRQDRR